MRTSGVPGRPGDPPGLQAERTVLAWDRTALALLGNGALLLVRYVRSTGGAALVPAVLALVAMLAVAVLGRRRGRRLRDTGGRGPAAHRELAVAGTAVALVAAAVLSVLVLGALKG